MKLKSNIAISENGFMFDPYTGDSYNLNNTGVEIIKHLKAGKTNEEILAELKQKYDVDDLSLEQNLYDFIAMLSHYDLLENA